MTENSESLSVQVLGNWRELEQFTPDWNALAASALEPSPSAEPWMLIPAMRHEIPGTNVRVALVFASNSGKKQERQRLCGVFPIEELRRYRGFPIRVVRFWNHIYSVSTAPLIHRDCALACVRAFFDWIVAARSPYTVAEFSNLRADSAFFEVLAETLRQDDHVHVITDMHSRAFFRPQTDAESYVSSVGSSHHRQEWRRQERRLREKGSLTYTALERREDAPRWVDEFVRLEMAGWKGRDGTAFGCKTSHRAWLEEVTQTAADQGRVMMLALNVNGKPVAMKLNILAAPGSYAFKIAYDEAFAKFSPGVLLELENVRRLHSNRTIAWMDSLAAPEHSLINRVWIDRTPIVSILVAPGALPGRILVSAFPLLRTLKQVISRTTSNVRA